MLPLPQAEPKLIKCLFFSALVFTEVSIQTTCTVLYPLISAQVTGLLHGIKFAGIKLGWVPANDKGRSDIGEGHEVIDTCYSTF